MAEKLYSNIDYNCKKRKKVWRGVGTKKVDCCLLSGLLLKEILFFR